MTIHRSREFDRVCDETYEAYGKTSPPGEGANEASWRRTYGAKWRNRVGLPRLVAQEALSVADGLVRSINVSIFRNEPEMQERLRQVRADLFDLAVDLGRENWRRFEGESDD